MLHVLKLIIGLSAGLILMGCAGLAHLKEFAHWTARLSALLQEPASTVIVALALWWIPPLLCEVVAFLLGLFIMVRSILKFGDAPVRGTPTI
jgi:hypothetical protein